jgi:hypothetical protein
MIDIDQESDLVPARPNRWSAIVFAGAIALSILATFVLVRRLHAPSESVAARPVQIDATPFVLATEHEHLRAAADRRLDSYGWVDRARGTIHVPLDIAIERYLGGAR